MRSAPRGADSRETEGRAFGVALWKQIMTRTGWPMSGADIIDNLRQTLDRGTSIEGTVVFSAIKSVIDKEVEGCDSVEELEALFEHGPWNEPEIQGVVSQLQGLNEYTNTVGYLFYRAIAKLKTSGPEGERAIRRLASTRNLDSYYYHESGGNSEPASSLI